MLLTATPSGDGIATLSCAIHFVMCWVGVGGPSEKVVETYFNPVFSRVRTIDTGFEDFWRFTCIMFHNFILYVIAVAICMHIYPTSMKNAEPVSFCLPLTKIYSSGCLNVEKKLKR